MSKNTNQWIVFNIMLKGAADHLSVTHHLRGKYTLERHIVEPEHPNQPPLFWNNKNGSVLLFPAIANESKVLQLVVKCEKGWEIGRNELTEALLPISDQLHDLTRCVGYSLMYYAETSSKAINSMHFPLNDVWGEPVQTVLEQDFEIGKMRLLSRSNSEINPYLTFSFFSPETQRNAATVWWTHRWGQSPSSYFIEVLITYLWAAKMLDKLDVGTEHYGQALSFGVVLRKVLEVYDNGFNNGGITQYILNTVRFPGDESRNTEPATEESNATD